MSTRQARRRQQRTRQQGSRGSARRPVNKTPWYLQPWSLLVAVGAVAVIVIIVIVAGQKTPKKGAILFNPIPATPKILNAVEKTAAATITSVGAGGLSNPWTALQGHTLATQGGKPVIDYDGAEYCPYCAADRWALINALSRFGTFSGLQLMKAQSNDSAGPSTNTFTFRTAEYKSSYLVFLHTEETNDVGDPLQTATGLAASMNQLNSSGGIPFVNAGNRASSSTTEQPKVLHADSANPDSRALTWQQIATKLKSPGDSIQTGIVGGGNWITAGICKLTDNKPAAACSNTAIQTLEAKVNFTK
jgi:hypothetical protein